MSPAVEHIQPSLRLVCQSANNKLQLSAHSNPSSYLLVDKKDLNDNQVAVYSSGSQLEWREVEGGQLPTEPRAGLKGTLIGEILFVTGGRDEVDGDLNYLTSILSWDPVAESWQQVGDLAVGRHDHAAVAVSKSVIGAC